MGAGTYYLPVLAAATTTSIASTPAELNLLDGSAKSTSSITICDADAFIVIDGTTTKQIPASDITTYVGAGTMSSFQLEDDDGTEVAISNAKEVKIIGCGVTTNWTDTDNGTDGDPYDLTITVDAAQTGITSILATDVKIGEDDQTKVDFADANIINLHANNIKAASIHNTSSKGDLRLYQGCNYVSIIPPALSCANWTLTLPANDGCNGQFLQTNGSGVTSWAASSGGDVVCDSSPQLGGSLDAQTNTILNIGHACNDILATGIRVIAGSAACPSLSFTGDPDVGFYSAAGNELGVSTNGTARFLFKGEEFHVGDCDNSKLSVGINIEQRCEDNEILALKSSDVGHGITSYAEADTYGFFKSYTLVKVGCR